MLGGVASDAAGGAANALKGRAARAAAKKALNLSPNDYAKLMQVKRMYPEVYAALIPGGIQAVKQEVEKQQTP
jgi:hypothetical protein